MSYRAKIHHLAALSPKGWCCGESLSMLVRRGNWTRAIAEVTCRLCRKRLQAQP